MTQKQLIAHLLEENKLLNKKNRHLKTENEQLNNEVIPLNFADLLVVCHQEFGGIQVEPSLDNCTTGGIGNPHGKLVPTTIRVWTAFPHLQEKIFGQVKAIYDHDQEPPGINLTRHRITGIGARHIKISSRYALRKQQVACVEDIFKVLVKDLIAKSKIPNDFKLGSDIDIVEQANALNTDSCTPSPNQEGPIAGSRIAGRADPIFVQKVEGGKPRLVLFIEYELPHKLSVSLLKQGLREIDNNGISNKIVSCVERAQREDAEETVAKVLTQVYHYMVLNGCQYAYLSTGAAFVFFHIEHPDWKTLYYYMHVSAEATFLDEGIEISQTSIAQVLAFYILACKADILPQNQRAEYAKGLPKWIANNSNRLEQMPETPSLPDTRPPLKYQPTPDGSQSPSDRRKQRQRSHSSMRTESPTLARRPSKDDSDDPSGGGYSTALPAPFASALAHLPEAPSTTTSQGNKQDRQTQTGSKKGHYDYCSHQCLLSLKVQGPLDPYCPNYECHPRIISKSGGMDRHAIDMIQLRELLVAQVIEDMDSNIEPLGIQGARGAIFKLTLESHGYTIIGKGTPPHYVHCLENEFAVYEYLRELQGNIIPVCLGAIDSPRCYLYALGPVHIYHWLMTSFAGSPMDLEEFQSPYQTAAIATISKTLQSFGLHHGDMSQRNILWEPRTRKLMLIDFERVILPPPKQRLKGKAEEKLDGGKVSSNATSPKKRIGERKATTDAEKPAGS
ncbi:MAG: hypothetical protein Q9186_006750 [Xanthomendoza sp. 1 TL-2023]